MESGAVARTGPGRPRSGPADTVTEWSARAGLAARGTIYVLVGLLALRVALGDRRKQADAGGALAELAGRPYGAVLLWALGIGVLGMAVWRLSAALFGSAGPDGRAARTRLLALGACVFYGFVAWSVLAFAAGSGGAEPSGDQRSRDVTARALGVPAGQWLVGAVAVGIAVAGVWIAVQAVRRAYHEELNLGAMSRRTLRLVDVTGVAGGVARGAVFAAAGAFAVRAAVDYRPEKAKGLDDTLRSFAATALGPWLLAVVAVGLMLFGLYSFAVARWPRV
ncbi:DUF1206 domain-containing protein [Streptomyces sp. NPDC005209]|uniref:DUF1206 domain-containing protein n=1 Tax=Streptomyces sp. NPDC005209 TaxID=3156715 RepID=UPI0033B18040